MPPPTLSLQAWAKPPKLNRDQQREAIARRGAGEALTALALTFHTQRRLHVDKYPISISFHPDKRADLRASYAANP